MSLVITYQIDIIWLYLCQCVTSSAIGQRVRFTSCTVLFMFCPQNLLDNTIMSSFGAPLHAAWLWVISDVWSSKWSADQYPGWRVDNKSPITVSTAYRWIAAAVQTWEFDWEEAETYALFPVMVQPSDVLRYSVHWNGPALSRESHKLIVPGDYGLYATGVFIC